MSALLSVRGLEVEFPTHDQALRAIDGVSFELAAGETLGIVGESGAGKSLMGSAIIGLIEPPGRIAGGEVWLGGRRIDDLPPQAFRAVRGREIGMVFQDPRTSLNPLFTVGRQLVDTMRAHMPIGHAEAERRALDWLKRVGIPGAEQRLHHYPHQFSGGMCQRVVIALALAADPKLVVADEPTTALDVSTQAQIMLLLKDLCRRQGTAVILITHSMSVIAAMADRVAVMYAGRIVEIGPVAEVIRRPQHPYAEGLVSAIPTLDRRARRLVQIDGAMPRLGAWPSGCSFHPRCGKAGPRCGREAPPLLPAGANQAACWLHDRAGTHGAAA